MSVTKSTESTTEPTMKSIAEEAILGLAEVTEVSVDLPATARCARCGAQAYVEVEILDKGGEHATYGVSAVPDMKEKREIFFCAHHYGQHESALVMQATRVIDHRPFLLSQERAFKGQ